MRTNIVTFIIITITIYISVCVLMYIFQDSYIFFPTKLYAPHAYLKKYEKNEIIIKNGTINLHGWLLNPGKSKLIFYYGGNAEEVSGNLDDFQKFKDYSVLLLNYRGYGKSNGSPSQKNLFEDALYAYDYILNNSKQKIPNTIVFGRSLGSGIATYVASKRQAGVVILVTPFDSIKNIAKRNYPFLPINWLLKHPFDSLKYVKNLSLPVLVLVAENDEIIAYKDTKNLIDNIGNNCKSVIIKNTGHNDIQASPSYWQEIDEFLNDF